MHSGETGQWQYPQPRQQTWPPLRLVRIDAQCLLILRLLVAQLDEQQTAVRAGRRMAAAGRILQPVAGRIGAMFIDKDPFEHQDFLASRMLMATELRTRRITHDRGGAY